ncbi:MAG: hypothetical protein U1E87_10005 [Alphaproteobacteria bacterium]
MNRSMNPAQPLRKALCVLAVAGLMLGSAEGAAPRDPREDEEDTRPPLHVVIGLDLSRSNPLVKSQDYAASAAGVVADQIADLPLRSVVMLRTFGSYEGESNDLRIDRSISNEGDERPAAVGALVREIIASVPSLVRSGRLDMQDNTNVIAFLENMSDFVDCKEMDAVVLLVSDGIESSEYAELNRPGEHLPKPGKIYRGCKELQIIGLGQGQKSPTVTEHLREEWEKWAKAAGFRSFSGYNAW